MTPLEAALIPGVVGVLGALAAWLRAQAAHKALNAHLAAVARKAATAPPVAPRFTTPPPGGHP
jgi:hypothetical protein